MVDVPRCHSDTLHSFQPEQLETVSRSPNVPVTLGPAGLDSALVACFPTPVDNQGEALLLPSVQLQLVRASHEIL
jgi:hypothetical protein